MFRSFEKNAKECENVAFFWKERMPNPGFSLGSNSRFFWPESGTVFIMISDFLKIFQNFLLFYCFFLLEKNNEFVKALKQITWSLQFKILQKGNFWFAFNRQHNASAISRISQVRGSEISGKWNCLGIPPQLFRIWSTGGIIEKQKIENLISNG